MKTQIFCLGLFAALATASPTPRTLRSLIRPRQPRGAAAVVSARQQNGLPGIGEGPAEAPDGTPIIEDEVVIDGLPIRFKISAPDAGAAALGVNVLFHGDGGQSFFDFPNAGVNNGLMGVALLSPDPQLRWGGFDANDNTGLIRPDGEAHSAAVNTFLTETLPELIAFDDTQIFMEGVSGGSLMLSGFTIPQFGASLAVPGVIFSCGGLSPQVAVEGDISGIRVHWQSTVDELPPLQESIPEGILAYQQIATDAGLSNAEINQLQTADASPNGGHCEFDEADFVDGVQLLTDNFSAILDGDGELNGVAVANGVVGNANLFAANGAAAAGGAAAGNNAGANAGNNNAANVGNGNGNNNNGGNGNGGANRNSVASQIANLLGGGQKQNKRRRN